MKDEKCKELLKRYSNPDGIGFPDVKEACKYAVDNFVPVSVIEDIKTEILSYKDDKIIHAETNEMIDIVLEIIDEHCGGEDE